VQSSELRQLKEKVERLVHLLEKRYGIPRKRKIVDPLDLLVQTILSQNTNDRNRDRAYQRLKARFPRWEDVIKAKREALIEAIRPGGLAAQKSRRIKDILRWIEKQYGRLSLVFLEEMDSEEIKRTMGGLKGIGPKTVHCLLLFGLGREAFPVDTHVLRVGKRLGLLPEKINAEKAHPWMVPLIPEGKSLSLHLNLIRHGREFCKAKNPPCSTCFLVKECLYPIE
jgi:endonuclease-3